MTPSTCDHTFTHRGVLFHLGNKVQGADANYISYYDGYYCSACLCRRYVPLCVAVLPHGDVPQHHAEPIPDFDFANIANACVPFNGIDSEPQL